MPPVEPIVPARSGLASSLSIGLVAPPWLPVPPGGYGGSLNVLDVLARGLQAAGHDVTLFTTGDSRCAVRRDWCFEHALGVGGDGVVHEARHVVEAYEALRGVDVVHDHTVMGALYAGSLERPALATNHGPFDAERSAIYRAVAARVPLVAISHHQATSAGDVPVSAVIHYGLDLGQVPVGRGEGGYALFLGRMHPDKGVDVAIRVARHAGIPLRIAAKMREPLEQAYFAERVRPLLGGDVTYLGEVNTSDKYALLGEASCLLNPVRAAEPFGTVMIEALAAGTPVVARTNGSAPELVDDGTTGFLCRDESELARAVGLASSLRRAQCRQVAEERYSAGRMVSEHVALYRRLLAADLGPLGGRPAEPASCRAGVSPAA